MVRGASASLLLLFTIISYSNSQTKEYDCPDKHFCKEKSSFEKNRDVLECKLDYECGIHQKCCSSCESSFKICTDVVVSEYPTNQGEYLKNKYCPKVNPCYTPLKYNPKYRCWSDESCTYGYKCCKSDCYIHKVCIVPINKEGEEIFPPPTTTSSTTTEESISTIVTTNSFPKSTLFLSTLKSEQPGATTTKSSVTMSPHQTPAGETIILIQTEISWPTTTSYSRTSTSPTVTTTAQEITKTQDSTEIGAPGNGFTGDDGGGDDGHDTGSGQYEKTETIAPVTISRHTTGSPTITTVVQKTSTSSKATTEVMGSGNGITDDDDGGDDDGDETGSGQYEKTETIAPVTMSRHTTGSPTITTVVQNTSASSKATTEVVGSGNGVTDDDDGGGDDGDETGSGQYEKTETIAPVTMSRHTTGSPIITTVVQNTSASSKATTEVVGSGSGVTDDDDGGGDDGDETGSGQYEKTETIAPVTISRHTTGSPTITTVVQKTSSSTKGTTEVVGSGNGITDDDDGGGDDGDETGSGQYEKTETIAPVTMSRHTTGSPTITTVVQKTSTSTKGTSEVVGSANGITDDVGGGGDDGDETGSGQYEKTETIAPVTMSRHTTGSPTITTAVQKSSTSSKGITEVVGSGNGVTDDDDGGADDGDETGIGQYEKTETIAPVTISRHTTGSPTITTVVQKTSTSSKATTEVMGSGNGITDDDDGGDDDGDETGSGQYEKTETIAPPTITTVVQTTSTSSQGTTKVVGSANGVTDDDGSGDNGDEMGSGQYEKTETIAPVTASRQATGSPTITTVVQKTSTSSKGTTEVVGSGNGVTDDDDGGGDDGDETGIGQYEKTETIAPITISRYTTGSPSITSIPHKTSASSKGTTKVVASGNGFANEDDDGDDNDVKDTGSGQHETSKTPHLNVTSTHQTTGSPSVTTIAQETQKIAVNTSIEKAITAIPGGTQMIISSTRNRETATETILKLTDRTNSKNDKNQTTDSFAPDFEFIKETTAVTKSQATFSSHFPTIYRTTSTTEEALSSGNEATNDKDITRAPSQSTLLAVTAAKLKSDKEYTSSVPKTEQIQGKPAQPDNTVANLQSKTDTPTAIYSVNESADFKEEGSAYIGNDIDEDNDDDSDNNRDVDEDIRSSFANRVQKQS